MIKVKEEHKSLIIVAAGLLVAYMLFDFILILFVAFLLITAFLPLVRLLKTKKIPRALSSTILVFTVLALPVALLVSIGPAIVSQTQSLVESTPRLLRSLEDTTGLAFSGGLADTLREPLSSAGEYIFTFSSTAFTAAISTVAVIVLTVYGLIYYDETSRAIIDFFARNNQQKHRYQKLLKNIEDKVGSWIKGQLIVSLMIGSLSWIAYVLLGLPFAGTLAVLAGLLELLPGLGPTLAAIPALLVALTVSPETFIFALVAYLIIQIVESYVITPRIMSHVIKLNPFITVIIVLTGTFLLGIVGAFLAIPSALFLGEIYKYLSSPKPNIA